MRRYFYWSQRRVGKIAEDNGIPMTASGSTRYKSPAIPFAPQVEIERPHKQPSRHDIAARVEEHLRGVTTTDFLSDAPAIFAKGCGTILFSEFITSGKRADIVSIFTESRSAQGHRIAICMFGSRDNLDDVISSSSTTDHEWTSSAAQAVEEFVRSSGRKIPQSEDSDYIALQALNLSLNQGGSPNQPARKGFTYGHVSDVGEWMMQVHRDTASKTEHYGYNRILVGAPLWVRTPSPQSLVLYGQMTEEERAAVKPLFEPERNGTLRGWLRGWRRGIRRR